MAERRSLFRHKALPYWLLAPQLLITAVFFLWPAWQAFEQSVFIEDAFGFSRSFVGLENFERLFEDSAYLRSFSLSILFAAAVTMLSMSIALALALAVERVLRGASGYKLLLVWPYAVAPVIAGVLWFFMFNPSIGIVVYWLGVLGYEWNHYMSGDQALALIVIASAWKQISYNFLFFLAGLHAIPRSVIEAAAIDSAGPVRRFWTITLPLLSPTTFFLLVVNVVYAFFETFGVVDATTHGGPGDATSILVYRVFTTGFIGQDYGGSAAQSVILMAMVVLMTLIQFRFIERRVVY